MWKRIYIIIFVLFVIFAVGCSKTQKSSKLKTLSLGMTKAEVEAEFGEPRTVKGALKNKYGQVIDVWEYRFKVPANRGTAGKVGRTSAAIITFGLSEIGYSKASLKDYWLYFVDDELVQWSEASDWNRQADEVYEIRFK